MTMSYNSLIEQVMDYLDRSDGETLEQVPNFISQAEQRICREAKNIGLEAYVTGSFVASEPIMAKPARWRRSLNFSCGTGTGNNTYNQLFQRSYEFIRNYWPDATQTGVPLYYSDYGYDHLLFAPTPADTYPFEYAYLELPEPLSASVQTNWLTNNAPDLLLYATLLEAAPYLKNDERIPVWTTYYDRALQSINGQDVERKTDRASNRGSD
jgi:hypothetical protein